MRSNWPSLWLSFVIDRSPSNTCRVTRYGTVQCSTVHYSKIRVAFQMSSRVNVLCMVCMCPLLLCSSPNVGRDHANPGLSRLPVYQCHNNWMRLANEQVLCMYRVVLCNCGGVDAHTKSGYSTLVDTVDCLSVEVVKIWLFLVGICVPRGMITLITPPTVGNAGWTGNRWTALEHSGLRRTRRRFV